MVWIYVSRILPSAFYDILLPFALATHESCILSRLRFSLPGDVRFCARVNPKKSPRPVIDECVSCSAHYYRHLSIRTLSALSDSDNFGSLAWMIKLRSNQGL